MSTHRPTRLGPPSLAFVLLSSLLVTLFLAGGASRSDALGQWIVRGAATTTLVIAALFVDRQRFAVKEGRFVLCLLGAAILLAALQLVPLPPAWWHALSGRDAFSGPVPGRDVWRPWSLVPSATINALASLITPLAVLLLALAIGEHERPMLLKVVLGLIVASMLFGLIQLSSGGIDNPFVNDTVGLVSGSFANRNHFALLLAVGCLIAPLWASLAQDGATWRLPIASGLLVVFLLLILASGSRAGILLGGIGLVTGILLARQGLRRVLRRLPRWAPPAIAVTVLFLAVIFVVISIKAGRAQSIDRAFTLDAGQDMRSRALPTVWSMLELYLPAGAGLGSFETLFRMSEPFDLLKPTYFNHAHNDYLEIVMDGGLPALALLIAGIGWWIYASIAVWRQESSPAVLLGRAGSTILLLVLIASIFDYPARTPIIMAVVILAGCWLSWGMARIPGWPLRRRHQ